MGRSAWGRRARAAVWLGVCASWACGGSTPPPAQATSPEDEAVLRDPVLDAVANPDATRAPRHAAPTDHRVDAANATAPGSAPAARGVGVRGITGSLTAFEVDEAMQTRSDALMTCVQQRPGRLGFVAGDIKFHIELDARGKVERVRVMQADIGLDTLERCLSDVVVTAPFPAPAGAERAEATWQMSVDPLSRGAEPIDPAELDDALTEQAEALYEACSMQRSQKLNVTGYIQRGKLSPASARPPWRGPARTEDITPEQSACVINALAEWRYLPKPARVSKVSFELRFVPKPDEPRHRRNKGKNKRKRR